MVRALTHSLASSQRLFDSWRQLEPDHLEVGSRPNRKQTTSNIFLFTGSQNILSLMVSKVSPCDGSSRQKLSIFQPKSIFLKKYCNIYIYIYIVSWTIPNIYPVIQVRRRAWCVSTLLKHPESFTRQQDTITAKYLSPNSTC